MNQTRQIPPGITVADQPTEDDLEALKLDGYAAVVNLRGEGEPEQPLDPSAEGERVRGLGMEYLHAAVTGAPLTEEVVGRVGEVLDRHKGSKVLVHCRKGGRAAALVLIHKALAEGWAPSEAFAKGQALGLQIEGGLRDKVEAYLKDHPPARGS